MFRPPYLLGEMKLVMLEEERESASPRQSIGGQSNLIGTDGDGVAAAAGERRNDAVPSF